MDSCVRIGLNWSLFPKDWIPALVTFCVTRLNMHRGRKLESARRANVLGFKPRYDYEYRTGFGQCCEVKDPAVVSNDASVSRTRTCISFYPTNNRQHSWCFMNLESGRIVTSSVWRVLPMNQLACLYMQSVQ